MTRAVFSRANCCCLRMVECLPDFSAQKCLIAESIEEAGHLVLFLPKLHLELNRTFFPIFIRSSDSPSCLPKPHEATLTFNFNLDLNFKLNPDSHRTPLVICKTVRSRELRIQLRCALSVSPSSAGQRQVEHRPPFLPQIGTFPVLF